MSSPLVVPFHRPSVGEEEIEAIADTLRSGWLTTGPRVAEFEKAFCAYTEAPFASARTRMLVGLSPVHRGESNELLKVT